MIHRLAVIVVGVAILSACTDPIVVPDGNSPWKDVTGRNVGYTEEVASGVENMAKLLGEALAEQPMRQLLHTALQQSPLNEHKLDLHEFFQSREGGMFRTVLQEISQLDQGQLNRMIQGLPAIDLYVPVDEHRMSWRSEDLIGVAAWVDLESDIYAYLPGDNKFFIDRWSGESPEKPFVILGPSELKMERPGFQRTDVGSQVIQGYSLRVPVFNAEEECDPATEINPCEDPGGGGGGDPDLWKTHLLFIDTYNVYDNVFYWEKNEFEVEWTAPDGSSGRTWRCTGVPSSGRVYIDTHCASTAISPASPFYEVDWVGLTFWETDAWPNPDDRWIEIGDYDPLYYTHSRLGEGIFLWREGNEQCRYLGTNCNQWVAVSMYHP